MIGALLTARAFLSRIPWQLWAAIAAAILLFVIWQNGKGTGKAVERAVQAETERKAVATAREADDVAHDTVEVKSNAVERENQRARKAAADGPDPLSDALRSLRAEQEARADPAAPTTGSVR